MFLLSYYIIFMHFVGLTYWQDAQCQFPVYVQILLQKVTSGNILGIGRKFMGIFYWINDDRSQKGGPGGSPQVTATTSPWPWSTSSSRLFVYKISRDLKLTIPKGFSKIRYRAPPPSPTSFGGQIVPVPAPYRNGDRPPEAISINTALPAMRRE